MAARRWNGDSNLIAIPSVTNAAAEPDPTLPHTTRPDPIFTSHYSLPTTHYSLLDTHHSLLTTHLSLVPTYNSPLVTHYPPRTAHHLLLTTHTLHCALLLLPTVHQEDKANLHYVLHCRALVLETMPQHLLDQIKLHKYHGGTLEVGDLDEGHSGMNLGDCHLIAT